MIQGVVTSAREAVIRLCLLGPHGQQEGVEAAVDTCFNGFLTLPSHVISQLGLPFAGSTRAILADGHEAHLPVFEAIVIWDDRPRDVGALQAEGSPLVGMAMLEGFDLQVSVVEGGTVTIKAIS